MTTRAFVKDVDRGYAQVMKRLASAHSVSVLVGVRDTTGDLATIAAANEFGTAHIPERSFLRSTVDEHRPKYTKLLAVAVEHMVDGHPPLLAYGRVGQVVVGDVQRKMRTSVPPPNAPSTIARKGSSTTLIDTGRLRQSIDYTLEGLGAAGAP